MLTPAQLEARKGKVTSSIVGAILGRDPFRSPRMAYHIIRGEDDRLPDSSPMLAAAAARGDRLEHLTLDYGGEAMGWQRQDADMVVHQDYPWAADNIDCLYIDRQTGEVRAGGEAKTVSMGAIEKWGAPGSGECPDHVLAQCHWHMLHHPVDLMVVPVLTGGYDFSFRHYVVPRDNALAGVIFNAAREFMETHVWPGKPPPLTQLDHDLLRGWYPEAEAEGIPTNAEIEAAAEDKVHWRDARKAAAEAEKLAEARLYEALGKASGAHSDRFKISWRNNRDSQTIDWQRMARDLGATDDMVAKYTVVKPGPRVLRVDLQKHEKQKAAL